MDAKSKSPLVYIVTGEASGDLLGGRLMCSLKKQDPSVRFAGVGGELMEKEGFHSLFPGSDLSVMGFFELLPHLFRLIKRYYQVKKDILEKKPNVVVTIDSPGFNFRLARALKKKAVPCPLIHYTAPTVWAWKPGRAQKIAKIYDHLLALFAFEPPYFEHVHLPCTFVGHPLIEENLPQLSPDDFRQEHNLSANVPLLCFLPGSREGEVEKMLTPFVESILLVKQKFENLAVVCPIAPKFKEKIEKAFAGRIPLIFTRDKHEKYLAMRASQVALAASGTVSLELALTETPMVIGYRMASSTHFLAKRLVKTPYICLVNILLESGVVPELIQEKCNPKNLSEALISLLADSEKACRQQRLSEVSSFLKNGISKPSDLAASTVLQL